MALFGFALIDFKMACVDFDSRSCNSLVLGQFCSVILISGLQWLIVPNDTVFFMRCIIL